MNEAPQQQGNITIDDVRLALGDTDPNATNASRLRALIGRGSLATIQRHLDTIRTEQAPQPLQATADAPVAPKDLIQGLWSAAWQSAQAQTAGALAAAQAKLAQTEQALSVARADAADAQGAADAAINVLATEQEQGKKTLEAFATEEEALSKALEEARSSAESEAKAAADHLATVKAEAALAAERAASALALAEAKHSAVQEAMRSEIDRLVNQLGDLRAVLRQDKGVEK